MQRALSIWEIYRKDSVVSPTFSSPGGCPAAGDVLFPRSAGGQYRSGWNGAARLFAHAVVSSCAAARLLFLFDLDADAVDLHAVVGTDQNVPCAVDHARFDQTAARGIDADRHVRRRHLEFSRLHQIARA